MNRLVFGVAAVALLFGAEQAQANLLVNGSFESFNAADGTNFGSFIRFSSPPANAGITGWTTTGSSGGNPNNVDLVNSSLYPAFAGSESLDMEGNFGASGVIQQSFVADSGTATLQFSAITNSGFGIALDAVRVAAVPEPSTLVMAGLGGFILLLRRKKLRLS